MTSDINTDLRIDDPDGFYEELIDLHRGFSDEQSNMINAKLVLLLANHIGDRNILRQAMELAKQDVS